MTSSRSFEHVSVSFLWTKKLTKDFSPDEKNLCFLPFSPIEIINFVLSYVPLSCLSLLMSPHHVGVHIIFSADPVGGGGSGSVSVASCPHSISLLNGHIFLPNLHKYIIGRGKNAD